jgi:hypothetical protein
VPEWSLPHEVLYTKEKQQKQHYRKLSLSFAIVHLFNILGFYRRQIKLTIFILSFFGARFTKYSNLIASDLHIIGDVATSLKGKCALTYLLPLPDLWASSLFSRLLVIPQYIVPSEHCKMYTSQLSIYNFAFCLLQPLLHCLFDFNFPCQFISFTKFYNSQLNTNRK